MKLRGLTEPTVRTHKFDSNRTFVENLHDCIKENKYVYGKDYIEIDLGEYLAFCPFNFYILKAFPGFFLHCVTIERTHWKNYFDSYFYGLGDLKTFFFKKSTLITTMKNDPMWEFTCWLNVRQCRITQHTKPDFSPGRGDNFHDFHDRENCMRSEYLYTAKPIIENNYDKIVRCFMDTDIYKSLRPINLI